MNADREHFYIKNGKSKFDDIGVSDILSQRLASLGYKCPSIIQHLFIKQYLLWGINDQHNHGS